MKSSLWILNIILAIFLLAIFVYIGFSLRKSTDIEISPLKPLTKISLPKYDKPKPKDIKYIYEGNDLFGTFSPTATDVLPVLTLPNLPQPPAPKPVVIQQDPEIQFLEPLPIKISGIIVSSIESNSQVSIVNTKTKETESYRVGDKIADAYIIRIFPNKIILIRSNGQQETLYMSPEDASEEIQKLKETSWTDVIQQQAPGKFIINSHAFVHRVTSLAQLIEMLDATTAFSKGESIGCRIGKMNNKSIGYALGLLPEDIIINIADIPPTTTTNRVNIYNKIFALKSGESVKVEIQRNGKKITNSYTIIATNNNTTNEESKSENSPPAIIKKGDNKNEKATNPLPKKIETFSSQLNTMNKRHNLKRQIYESKKRDRQAMLQFGSRESVLKNLIN
jgi:hypothetical protein